MKRLGITTALALCAPLLAQAALPPQYQRQRELQSIITSDEVAEALPSQPIDSISTTGDDVYSVKGGTCSVDVRIVSDPAPGGAGWVGPRQYHLDVGVSVCRGQDSE